MVDYPRHLRKDMLILSLINIADELQDYGRALDAADIDDIEKSIIKIQSLIKEKNVNPRTLLS